MTKILNVRNALKALAVCAVLGNGSLFASTGDSVWVKSGSGENINLFTRYNGTTGGRISIGTTNIPGSNCRLMVNGGAAIGYSATTTNPPTNGLLVTGNVGIGTGTAAPTGKLQVQGTLYGGSFNGGAYKAISLGASGNGYGAVGYGIAFTGTGATYNYTTTDYASWIEFESGTLLFKVAPSGTGGTQINPVTAMTISNSGNVGIGTTAPSSKLAVNGTIRAKEVIVTAAGWPDRVFKPDYNLKPLHEVESYIKKNSHLEGIPSEKEVMTKGVPMGEMQAKLLQKLEETTLYLIEMKKENEQLKSRLAAIEQKIR